MRKSAAALVCLSTLACLMAVGCATSTPATAVGSTAKVSDTTASVASTASSKQEASSMTVSVNGKSFSATFEDTEAARALKSRLSQGTITLSLRDYAGFEKVGDLGFAPPASDKQMTTKPGDIVLYAGDQIVFFYGKNSWSYTKLAHVDNLAGWSEALGKGKVKITLSLATKTGKNTEEPAVVGTAKTLTASLPATRIKSLKASKKAFTVRWSKRAKTASGYQIAYSTTKKFNKKLTKTATVKKAAASAKKISGLKSKKTYYVKVRTFAKKGGGVYYYSPWSKARKVKTK